MELETMGIVSLLPAVIAIVLSFITKNTIVSLLSACLVGTLVCGQGFLGLPDLMKASLGTTVLSWLLLLNMMIAILVAFFHKTGAIQAFAAYVDSKNFRRKQIQILSWLLGMFVYFSDSFSPLFVGTTMREISDKARVSREKLAYIADSGAAPVSVLVPVTGWAAYLTGLTIGIGCIVTQEDAMALFIKAMPMNFYAVITIIFVGLIASGIIPDFGPMKKAEERAMKEGKVLADGAVPLVGKELTEMQPYPGLKPRIFLNFVLPVIMIIVIAISTYIKMSSAKTMEAFLYVAIFVGISMLIQGIPFKEVMDTVMQGIKGGVPAVTLLALAYSVNDLSKQMGTANYIVSIAEGFLSPALIPAIIFVVAALMAFSTGSSWGTFAICMPIALPLAFTYSGGEITTLVVASFAAVAGGGVFGDHCSPLSDTTVLASTGSGSDHIDHVKTQLPYALVCGGLSTAAYLVLGFVAI